MPPRGSGKRKAAEEAGDGSNSEIGRRRRVATFARWEEGAHWDMRDAIGEVRAGVDRVGVAMEVRTQRCRCDKTQRAAAAASQ